MKWVQCRNLAADLDKRNFGASPGRETVLPAARISLPLVSGVLAAEAVGRLEAQVAKKTRIPPPEPSPTPPMVSIHRSS
ncbi:MAG: hypothetical protein QOJ19_4276 [Acidimicrobiia bacterium]|nr:hypothetical protein [Acidimicrobiia bacterium]